MQVYYNLEDIKYSPNRILTVGTYDGVHIGHQYIIKRLTDLSSSKSRISKTDKYDNIASYKSMLVTFEPHPQIFFNKSIPSLRLLTTIEERLDILKKLKIDEVFIVPFDKEFANMEAKNFIINYLYNKIGFSDFLVGFNHNFGRNREGTYELIKQLELPDVNIISCEPVFFDDITVSSTKIRNAIVNKKLELANSMLGRFYSVSGVVVNGNKVGKKIGFPTANIQTDNKHKLIPPDGVYSCDIKIFDEIFQGMASIGTRPTFNNSESKNTTTTNNNNKINININNFNNNSSSSSNIQHTLEVNIFKFDKDIYGAKVEVYFKKFLREEIKFNSVDELVEQIKKDKIAATI